MSNRNTKQSREVRVARPGPFFVVGCVVALAGVLFASGAAVAQPPAAPPPHLPLDALVKEYKRYGRPFPPANAQLVRINWDLYYGNEQGKEPYGLIWRIPPAKPGDRERYLKLDVDGVDFEELRYSVEPNMVDEPKITPDVLRSDGYTYTTQLLSFAIQCKDRGWDDLANVLCSSAREHFTKWRDPEDPWPGELYEIRLGAFRYWNWTRLSRGGDRKEALRHLTTVAAEEPELGQLEWVEQLMRRLKLTVDAPKSKPGTVEALIDELTEYWHDPWRDDPPVEPEWASYWKLAELGFDAVPILIKHAHDERLTRAKVRAGIYSYDVTIGDLCRQLLFDLSAGTITGGSWEEGGSWKNHVRPDSDEAEKWFEQAKKIGEEKWLLDHAMPPDDVKDARWRHWARVVRVIGAKYPARLPDIYRATLKKPVGYWIADYVNEIVVSKLSREQKVALLEEGAAHDDLDHQLLALNGFAKLDRAALREHLLALLRQQIPLRRAKSEFRAWDVPRLLRLAEAADDQTCWEFLALAAKFSDIEVRMRFIEYVVPESPPDQKDPHRLERIRFLVQFLDDATAEVDASGTKIEVRDHAASRLAGLLGFSVRRQIDTYWPVHPDLGPLTRILFRELMRQTAAKELAAAK